MKRVPTKFPTCFEDWERLLRDTSPEAAKEITNEGDFFFDSQFVSDLAIRYKWAVRLDAFMQNTLEGIEQAWRTFDYVLEKLALGGTLSENQRRLENSLLEEFHEIAEALARYKKLAKDIVNTAIAERGELN